MVIAQPQQLLTVRCNYVPYLVDRVRNPKQAQQ
eukprot:COSAG06_NODE_50941_length_315_cov_0.898148_1_plen_32_part_01